jgi:hypothetical protein
MSSTASHAVDTRFFCSASVCPSDSAAVANRASPFALRVEPDAKFDNHRRLIVHAAILQQSFLPTRMIVTKRVAQLSLIAEWGDEKESSD